jgi:hypothetical protein
MKHISASQFVRSISPVSVGTNPATSDNTINPLVLILFGLLFIILVTILLIIVFKRFAKNVKQSSMEKKSLKSVIFEVRVPKNNEIEVQAADQMFSNLLGISEELKGLKKTFGARSFISFELIALPNTIRFYVVASQHLASTVEKNINAAYPEAEVIISDEYNLFAHDTKVEFSSITLKRDNYKPIRTYEDLSTDPLSSITGAMSKLSSGESLGLQAVVTSAGSGWRNEGKGFVRKVRDNNADPEKKKINVDDDVLGAIEKKCELGGFNVDLRLVSTAESAEKARINLDTVVRAFDQFAKEGSNSFTRAKKINKKQFVEDYVYRFPRESFILNTAELASIYHFPNQNVKTPHIHWLLAKRAPAPAEVASTGDTWIGINVYRDEKKQIYFSGIEDRRRHAYIIGKTGSGKSYLLQNLALQDIYNGHGVAFLDPHGDSANWIMERIPANRIEDVIYFNPADIDRPVGFNILEHRNEQEKHMNVNAFLALMDKMFDPHGQGITGPRFQQAVRNAMLTAMEFPDMTLLEVVRIITDQKFTDKLIPKLSDPVVKRYWTDQIAKTADFHKSEILGYVVSKFEMFTTNKLTRNIFGQSKSGFNLRDIMDNQKILIVNLSKGEVGAENSQFLGLTFVPKILASSMSRADLPEEQRKDFFLYVDEFQNFATPDFAQILSEARKYRLNLTVANQYIAQMNENIREAVFGNVGTTISYKVGPNDAQYLETQFAPTFTAADLQNIENINAYINLLSNGENPGPFSINTHYKYSPRPVPEGSPETAALVKSISRLRYGRDVNLVTSEINRRTESLDSGEPVQGSSATPAPPTRPGGFSPPLQ